MTNDINKIAKQAKREFKLFYAAREAEDYLQRINKPQVFCEIEEKTL